jgi:endogenous inhibitor of DNA gyrase (YacG/DUF329 family)
MYIYHGCVDISMEAYSVECPICEQQSVEEVELPDTSVIYNVEAYETQPSLLWTWRRPDPDAKHGPNMLIDQNLITSNTTQCDEEHHIIVRSCHYGEVDDEDNMLYGPSNKPQIRCPRCEYKLGDHSEFIYRAGSSKTMQYILRSISTNSDPSYHHTEAITRSVMGEYNQLSTVRDCKGCGIKIHLNFSNKVFKEEEKYEGFKQRS